MEVYIKLPPPPIAGGAGMQELVGASRRQSTGQTDSWNLSHLGQGGGL